MIHQEENRRFGGISRLYTEKHFVYFQQSHICIVGLGGVGSWVAESLARTGIGQLTLIDLDNVALSNINRQQPAVTSQLGMPKVEAMAKRILDINPDCRLHLMEDFVDEANISEIFSSPFHFVVDAIDQVRVKAAMAHYFLTHNQNFVVSGGAGGRTDLLRIERGGLDEVTHDSLLANMRYTLRKRYDYKNKENLLKKIPCIFSRETIVRPENTEVCDMQGLSCAGFGASMMVTAAFGLACSTLAIEGLIKQSNKLKQ